MRGRIGFFVVVVSIVACVGYGLSPQSRRGGDPQLAERRQSIEEALQSIAVVERKLMVPMRDGKRMATDVYRPKDASKKVPDHLRPHAVQLQLLGRSQRRAARYDRPSSTPSSAATPTSR